MIWASSKLLPNQDSPARHTLRVPAPARDSRSPYGDKCGHVLSERGRSPLVTEWRSGLIECRQVVEQAITLFGRYHSTPRVHFRHFPIPLRACEALLAHHVLVVAAEAGDFIPVGFGLSFGLARGG